MVVPDLLRVCSKTLLNISLSPLKHLLFIFTFSPSPILEQTSRFLKAMKGGARILTQNEKMVALTAGKTTVKKASAPEIEARGGSEGKRREAKENMGKIESVKRSVFDKV